MFMRDDCVAARCEGRHDFKAIVVQRAIDDGAGRNAELVEQIQPAPQADRVAVVAPRIVALR